MCSQAPEVKRAAKQHRETRATTSDELHPEKPHGTARTLTWCWSGSRLGTRQLKSSHL